MVYRQDRLPIHRRRHDTVAQRGVDPPPRPTRRRLLPDPRGPLGELGGGREGVRPPPDRCGLEPQRVQLDVAVVLGVFSSVLPMLLAGCVREENRS